MNVEEHLVGLSRRAYADHRGCSEKAVRKAIAAGRIELEPDGTIDPDKADGQWAARSRRQPAHPGAGQLALWRDADMTPEAIRLLAAVQLFPELAPWVEFCNLGAAEMWRHMESARRGLTDWSGPAAAHEVLTTVVVSYLVDAGRLSEPRADQLSDFLYPLSDGEDE